jgi:hypothetical protein
MRLEDVQTLLRKRCEEAGSMSAFADQHDINKQYISQVINGHRPPSERLCGILGIRSDGIRWIKS